MTTWQVGDKVHKVSENGEIMRGKVIATKWGVVVRWRYGYDTRDFNYGATGRGLRRGWGR